MHNWSIGAVLDWVMIQDPSKRVFDSRTDFIRETEAGERRITEEGETRVTQELP